MNLGNPLLDQIAVAIIGAIVPVLVARVIGCPMAAMTYLTG